jgi:ABC-type antimicrobial peptide transport system ATPase subunit
MNLEDELMRLSGQQAATQMILVGLCRQLREHSSEGEAVVANSFDYAAKAIERASPKITSALSQEQLDVALEAALATLEQLGIAALRGEFLLQV